MLVSPVSQRQQPPGHFHFCVARPISTCSRTCYSARLSSQSKGLSRCPQDHAPCRHMSGAARRSNHALGPPAPCPTAPIKLAPAVACPLGGACFQACQTLSNPSLRMRSTSNTSSFETTPVAPDEAANFMRPALDSPVSRQRDRSRRATSSSSGLTCLVTGFFQTFCY